MAEACAQCVAPLEAGTVSRFRSRRGLTAPEPGMDLDGRGDEVVCPRALRQASEIVRRSAQIAVRRETQVGVQIVEPREPGRVDGGIARQPRGRGVQAGIQSIDDMGHEARAEAPREVRQCAQQENAVGIVHAVEHVQLGRPAAAPPLGTSTNGIAPSVAGHVARGQRAQRAANHGRGPGGMAAVYGN